MEVSDLWQVYSVGHPQLCEDVLHPVHDRDELLHPGVAYSRHGEALMLLLLLYELLPLLLPLLRYQLLALLLHELLPLLLHEFLPLLIHVLPSTTSRDAPPPP